MRLLSAWVFLLSLGSVSALDVSRHAHVALSRRTFLTAAGFGVCSAAAQPAVSRTPGSEDVSEAIEQIITATAELKRLQGTWATYACIDKEGRACNIDAARKILGGVAPQRGDAAIAVAKETPLYRIDGAFKAVRKYALNASDTWAENLDVTAFVEKGEDIVLSLRKVDDAFYGVVFASKGSTMLENIYADAKKTVDVTLLDFEQLLALLREAGAPGV